VLFTSATSSENTGALSSFASNTQFGDGWISGGASAIFECFRRAPGFFDVVCYTGTNVVRTVNHNLGVVPELIIVKKRNSAEDWAVYSSGTGNTQWLVLNSNSGPSTAPWAWNDTSPTASVFTVGAGGQETNGSGWNYVAYLFASCPGVSKVGSYTGNGGSSGTSGTGQTINCGFTNGARFVLIRRSNSVGGDWYVWDSARGIVSGGDPYLVLNSTAAEATGVDVVDPDSSGFIVNQTPGPNLNITGVPYIFLAIA
jgi:hypothetical protein